MVSYAYTAVGWDMYDPRMTLKGEAGEDDIEVGACCWIHTDGEIYLTDNSASGVHGCALTSAKEGDELVLVTHGRLRVATSNIPGAQVYGQLNEGGSVPDDNTDGNVVGFAIEDYLVFVHIDSDSVYK